MVAPLTKLSRVLQTRVDAELRSGEIVTWVGQPNPTQFMRYGFLVWLFFIPWTAFSAFWIAGASGFKMPNFAEPHSLFPLFGLPFLAIGIAGLGTPLWLRRKAEHMVYVITNQRAFSIEGAKSITVRSYAPNQLTKVTRKENPDGSGDLVFDAVNYEDSNGNTRKRERGFYAIAAVREVERMVERLASVKPA